MMKKKFRDSPTKQQRNLRRRNRPGNFSPTATTTTQQPSQPPPRAEQSWGRETCVSHSPSSRSLYSGYDFVKHWNCDWRPGKIVWTFSASRIISIIINLGSQKHAQGEYRGIEEWTCTVDILCCVLFCAFFPGTTERRKVKFTSLSEIKNSKWYSVACTRNSSKYRSSGN